MRRLPLLLALFPVAAAADISVVVTPAATGKQLVRFSLPLEEGQLPDGHTLEARNGRWKQRPAVRVLNSYPSASPAPRSARTAIVTFPYEFSSVKSLRFSFRPIRAHTAERFPATVRCDDTGIAFRSTLAGGAALDARLIAPARASHVPAHAEVVEESSKYLWARFSLPDPKWPREIELRADSLGNVVVVARLQRMAADGVRAPDFGWDIRALPANARDNAGSPASSLEFSSTQSSRIPFDNGRWSCAFPQAALRRTGSAYAEPVDGGLHVVYRAFRQTDAVPMQFASWRRAEFVLGPAESAPLTAALTEPHRITLESDRRSRLPSQFEPVLQYHRDAIIRSMAVGADLGNVTGYNDGSEHGGSFGMNRLNHAAPIFAEGRRACDRRLIDTALLWCDNFIDQSIWWGPGETGGTRYNNLAAMGKTPPDTATMWRSDSAVSFCTKGFEAFYLAYRETGDPRYLEAVDAQVAYCRAHMTAGVDYARNIGVVRDFLGLYRQTGDRRYVDDALKLFRDLRPLLSSGDLFTESGKPIDPDPPFIDDDQAGYRHPFAKPYIIGYALEGLPDLARLAPAEPKLRAVVRAVADFMASSQDRLGGWRYPHPQSSSVIMSQAMEHAWQLVQADTLLGPQPAHLDAVERVLRQRILGWKQTGRVFSGLGAWERSAGQARTTAEMTALYKRPGDRDVHRDYREGSPSFGSSPPEGIVYFPEVLAWYLRYRPASRLLAPPASGDPLGMVLSRSPARSGN